MKKGVTLVELLVVIAITFVVGAGIFTLYRTLVGSYAEHTSIIKNEAQLNLVLDNIKKIISNAGFGMGIGGDFPRITYLSAPPSNLNCWCSRIVISTSAITGDSNTEGCWGIIDENGNFILQASSDDNLPITSSLGKACPQSSSYYTRKISIANPQNTNCSKNCLAFPEYQTVEIYFEFYNNQNRPSQCLPGTGGLKIKIGNSNPEDIISCVAHVNFHYIIQDRLTGRLRSNTCLYDYSIYRNIDRIIGVTLQMTVQLSESPTITTTTQSPFYKSAPCAMNVFGSYSVLNPNVQNWQTRKWATVELNIYTPNSK